MAREFLHIPETPPNLRDSARRVSQVVVSLRDVQELAGHTSLAMTQRYIEGDTEAKRKLVALL